MGGLLLGEFNVLKDKQIYDNYEKRKQNLLDAGLEDLAILENHGEQKLIS